MKYQPVNSDRMSPCSRGDDVLAKCLEKGVRMDSMEEIMGEGVVGNAEMTSCCGI